MHLMIRKLAMSGAVVALLLMMFAAASPAAFATGESQAHATLKHTPRGTATLSWNAQSENLTVTIRLFGLTGNSTHPAHIHAGDCDDNGPIVYPLNNVVANAAGDATVTTVIHEVEGGIPNGAWYVNVHNGPGLMPPPQFDPIACGNVLNPNHAHSVVVFLGGTNAPNQSASGSARLTLSNETLTVVVTVSGLVPGSVHPAHIHAGSCESQLPGSIVYGLNSLVGDAHGNATSVTVIKDVESIPEDAWYVNVHRNTHLNTQTGFDPIACGDVED
jgi:CHRD domain